MNAGQFRHRITIQKLTGDRETSGDESDTWETFKTAWASIEPVYGSMAGGREPFVGDLQYQGISDVRMVMRYTSGVTPKHRVLFCGRIFDILAVHNKEEMNREMELLCKEHQ